MPPIHAKARHPEALAKGTTYVDMLPTHAKETSTIDEGVVANSSCPPLVGDRNLRFRGGQLFERDSSVVSLPQNDCKKVVILSTSEKSLTKKTCHPEFTRKSVEFTKLDFLFLLGDSESIHLIGKPTIIDSGSESGMTVKKCKNYVILSDSEKSQTKKSCHPEALAEGSLTNVITPHLEITDFGPPTRGGHEYTCHLER